MWSLPHLPHCQDSRVLPLATRCQDTLPVLRGVELEQVGIVKWKVVRGYWLAHIITVTFAVDCAVYSSGFARVSSVP